MKINPSEAPGELLPGVDVIILTDLGEFTGTIWRTHNDDRFTYSEGGLHDSKGSEFFLVDGNRGEIYWSVPLQKKYGLKYTCSFIKNIKVK